MAYEKMVDLVLTGEILPGHNVLDVKARMAATFKRSAAEVEHLFASVPFVVKKDLPESQLATYLEMFKGIGAVVRVEPASSVVALIGTEAAAAVDPAGRPRTAPPPFTSTEPLGPADAPEESSASAIGAGAGSAEVTCPKCGHVQGPRTLCIQCGTDMPRFRAAQQAAAEPASAMPQYAAPQAIIYSADHRELPPVIGLSAEGRIGRLRYLAWGIPAVLAFLVAVIVFLLSAASGHVVMMLLGIAAFVAGLVVILRLSLLRLHDLGRSGWWVMLYFVPVINLLLHLALIAVPGDRIQNEYGPVPEANTPLVYVGAALSGLVYLIDLIQVFHLRH
jgi:uncharacterized membrane protein YhaH (DUF805 family)